MLHGKETEGKTQVDIQAQERPQWFSHPQLFPFSNLT